jgi:hypothetical protein
MFKRKIVQSRLALYKFMLNCKRANFIIACAAVPAGRQEHFYGAIRNRRRQIPGKLAAYGRSIKEKGRMKPKMAPEKPNEEEFEAGPCLNPAVGKDRIVAYITDEMSQADRESFIAHVAECKHCLQEVVLWRTAEEIVDRREDRPPQEATQSA